MKTSNSPRSTYLALLICTLPSSGCGKSAQDKQTRYRESKQAKENESTGLAEKAKGGSDGVSDSDELTASNGQTKGEVTRAKQVRTTKIKIAFLQCDIERYYSILGVYPKTLEGLAKPPDDAASREKWEAAGGLGIAEILPDPWGRRIQYELATEDSYRIWSMEPDGRNNTDDDIITGADNSNVPSPRRLDLAKAKEQVQLLAYFVESYATDMGSLPLSLVLLKTPPDDKKLASRWKGPYMKIEIDTDPWGNQYDYMAFMVGPDNAFAIFSYGPNGASENGGGDDISSRGSIVPREQ